MLKRKIAIIGGGGYLGIHVISRLQLDPDYSDYDIYAIDLELCRFSSVSVDYDAIHFIKGSFLDGDLLDKTLEKAEIVFHIAATGVMGLSGGNREQIQRVNVEGTRFLLQKCRQFGVKRFVYASSVAVSFVGEQFRNLSEDDPLPPPEKYLNYYSVSKADGEKMVLEESCSEFKTCALRFRAIYGPEEPNGTRRVIDLIKSGIFIAMIKKYDKQAVTQASSINNCSKAFLLADKMLQKPDGAHGKPYHILDAEIIGAYDFWAPLIESLGFTRPTRFVPYNFIILCATIAEFFCYNIIKKDPILTAMEITIMSVDNTYSLENAKRDMGYIPEKGMMDEVVKFHKKEKATKKKNSNFFNPYTIILFVILFSLAKILV